MTQPLPPSSNSAVTPFLPWLVAIAFFMESLDTTIINTAVPVIAQALHSGPLSLKAALTSYTLSLAVFIPVSGWFADRFGTRQVFALAIGTFTLGSLLCGMSVNLPMLVVSRIIQGMGGAMMMPVGRIALVRSYPKDQMLKAMSFVAIPGLIGPLIGPVTGGTIVHLLHWRAIFFVNLPIGIAGLYWVLRLMPEYRAERPTPLDKTGFFLFGSGIALLSYVLEVFGEHGMQATSVALLATLAAALLLGYAYHAARSPMPLLKTLLFRIRTFQIAVCGSFLTRLGVGGMPFLLPLLYQIGLGFEPWQAGLMLMPQAAAAMTMKVIVQRVLATLGYRRVLIINTCLIGLMIILFSTVDRQTSIALIVAQAFTFGFFSSLQYSSMNTLVFSDIGADDTSKASTIASTVQQLSISFGIALASMTTSVFLGDAAQTSHSMINALHHAFVALGVVTIASSLMFWRLRSADGKNVSQHTN